MVYMYMYIVMIRKEDCTKIVCFMTPFGGDLVRRNGYIGLVKIRVLFLISR